MLSPSGTIVPSIFDCQTQIVRLCKLQSTLHMGSVRHVDNIGWQKANGTALLPCIRVPQDAGTVSIDWIAAIV